MSVATWDPCIAFNGGQGVDQWGRAAAIVGALSRAHTVTDLGGGLWRVFGFGTPTQAEAIVALAQLLAAIDPQWQEVLRIVKV
jgi:hypothetical protein